MQIVRFLWYTLLCILLFCILLIVIVGTLWVLRVAVFWWFDVDYVEEVKKWHKTIR